VGHAHFDRKANGDLNSDDQERLIQSVRESTLGAVKRIARYLNYSQSAVYKMVEDENRSPLEAVVKWTEAALRDLPRKQALAQVYFLVDYFLGPDEIGEPASRRRTIVGDCSDAMRDVGTALTDALLAAEDGVITPDEYETFDRECNDAERSLELLRRQMKVNLEESARLAQN
jgi:hypothetical protein